MAPVLLLLTCTAHHIQLICNTFFEYIHSFLKLKFISGTAQGTSGKEKLSSAEEMFTYFVLFVTARFSWHSQSPGTALRTDFSVFRFYSQLIRVVQKKNTPSVLLLCVKFQPVQRFY